MTKRNLFRILAATALIAIIGFAVESWIQKRAEQKREAEYKAVLREYSAALKVGSQRDHVESFIRSKGQSFQRTCCLLSPDQNAWEDLVKIGSERTPWYCSESNIYLDFEFYAPPHPGMPQAEPSDSLRTIALTPWLEGCL